MRNTPEPNDALADMMHRPVKYWAPLLGLGEKTLRDAIRDRELRHVRVGDRVLISRSMVEEWLAANERKPRSRSAAA